MLNLLMSSLALLNVDGVVTFLLISKIYGTLNRISRLERKGFTSIQQHRNVNLAMHAMFSGIRKGTMGIHGKKLS